MEMNRPGAPMGSGKTFPLVALFSLLNRVFWHQRGWGVLRQGSLNRQWMEILKPLCWLKTGIRNSSPISSQNQPS